MVKLGGVRGGSCDGHEDLTTLSHQRLPWQSGRLTWTGDRVDEPPAKPIIHGWEVYIIYAYR